MTKAGARWDGTLAVAATFTAEPLEPALRFLIGEAGLSFDVGFASYNQVFQELLSPSSLLGKNAGGVNVILVRCEDFVRDIHNVAEARATIQRIVPEICDALKLHCNRVQIPIIVGILPASPRLRHELSDDVENANARVAAFASSLSSPILLQNEDIDLVATQPRYDSVADELGHIPFSEYYYAALAAAIIRKVHALRVPAHKVLVLDCDETLWRGVVGEDGVEGISIPSSLVALQTYALEARRKGVLLCLASKNSERDVLDVFARRDDMALKLTDIVAHRINWQSKPTNIRSLARELNLGLDSFVFIDDNPVECALMRSELPQVVTLQLPTDLRIPPFLSHLWTFDKFAVTVEDARRTEMYRENAARQQSEDAATDIATFIKSLEVVTDIASPEESEWPRLAQMTQRTNQFNFTTIRRTEAEMRGLPGSGYQVLRVKVRDRFGEYGIVGLVIARAVGTALVVDTFLLSCRVLGRGVEHTILRRLAEIGSEQALTSVDLPLIETAKNEPARAFADSVAAAFRVQDGNRINYRMPVDVASAIVHRPGHDPEAVTEARKAEERKGASPLSATAGADRSERYARLAQELASDVGILSAMRADAVRERKLTDVVVPPSTSTEISLVSLWRDLLGLDRLGIDDDYFALGGTSLIAARMFADIARRFDIRLPLTTILDAPTIRKLAVRLARRDPMTQAAEGGLVRLKGGGPRNLFLVHDGDGETLLYQNLAQRMPNDISVYGIEPRRIVSVPLAHATIEDMAGYYLQLVRKKQPQGPYLLGGLCAGGVIAYEMASQFERAGETVELVAILDAAAPRTLKKRGRVARARLARLQGALGDPANPTRSRLQRATGLAATVLRKAKNTLAWEVAEHGRRLSVQLRFRLLRRILSGNAAWPKQLPELTVRQIYDTAEADYAPRPLAQAHAVLFRARHGEGNDTAYRDVYADERLGWGTLVRELSVIDVDGGHSSMLQEQYVGSISDALLEWLGRSHKELSPLFAAEPNAA